MEPGCSNSPVMQQLIRDEKMSQQDISGLASRLASKKPTKIPAMSGKDFKDLFWWLDYLQRPFM